MKQGGVVSLVPGIVLCLAIASAAYGIEMAQRGALGRAWLDALLIAILLGTVIRTSAELPATMAPGIRFSAKPVLEVAIVLLGLTLDVPALLQAGPILLLVIVAAVVAAYAGAYAVGRALGLSSRLAALVAIGNAICGNSAIAAAAPVVEADAEDVAAAIAFTAVLGVVVVLLLPFAGAAMSLGDYEHGVVAGLTVYAVPQVLAATLPVSILSAEVGTLVKLTRVLLLGPALVAMGLWARRSLGARADGDAPRRPPVLPWFIAGFIAMALLRATGVVPEALVDPVRSVSRVLTIVALAALGLGVDFRAAGRYGTRVAGAAACGILILFATATLLVLTVL
ncbi:MAG: putative sulfate exporter family transporter [Gemmatimonadaceae bacterium]|nr:putative sulfate exporter family transporter [Gemmatimonadaceae bacterium]